MACTFLQGTNGDLPGTAINSTKNRRYFISNLIDCLASKLTLYYVVVDVPFENNNLYLSSMLIDTNSKETDSGT